MKRIMKFSELFESSNKLTEQQILWLDRGLTPHYPQRYKRADSSWSFNESTGLVDVHGSFKVRHSYDEPEDVKSKIRVKFGTVTHDFKCDSEFITTLENSPRIVGGTFDCSKNEIKSLEGGPVEVGGDYDCEWTKITSLKGAPKRIGGNFKLRSSELTTLMGGPEYVGGDLDLVRNKLIDIKGAPKEVGGDFICDHNRIVSLEGAPERINNDFNVSHNKLKDLKGSPKWIGKTFDIRDNDIKTLADGPEYIGEYYFVSGNSLISLEGSPIGLKLKDIPTFDDNRGLSPETLDIIEAARRKSPKTTYNTLLIKNLDKFNSDDCAILMKQLSNKELDKYFKENPIDLYWLDELPEIKSGVLQRTGIKDWSKLGRLKNSGLL